MTQMYAPAPVCSASRVGLLTGRFPARAGQPGNGPMDASETTIGEVFRDGGYATGHVGVDCRRSCSWRIWKRTPVSNTIGPNKLRRFATAYCGFEKN